MYIDPNLTLTHAHVVALREANTLCYDDSPANGQCIRAIKNVPSDGAPMGYVEVTTRIPVVSSSVHNYGEGQMADEGWKCFAMMMHPQYDDNTRTLVGLLAKNYWLEFVWTRDNNSPVTREAGIVVDHLDVVVVRPSSSSRPPRRYTLRMATFIGKDNSARMIR